MYVYNHEFFAVSPFQIMDRDGGLQAMSALNGIRLEGSPKPLSVQLYVSGWGSGRGIRSVYT